MFCDQWTDKWVLNKGEERGASSMDLITTAGQDRIGEDRKGEDRKWEDRK
jgi:hypothetical protein